ncbi:hypothetical protein WN71_016840 [Streptomyces mangrovisoli]|uniref:Endolytic murein transglycosylase n=1 Tax=Streptomyces mangrovisoli TaxID=1428628 RepID=A0A1J4NVU5_9ACTN|nr:hypothetical protein WN71_016840 [Streptomyces mangrovisoli]
MYGDGGWAGQQAQAGQQSSYGGHQQHQPQQPQQQNGYGDWGQQAGHDQQQYGQQQYPQQYGHPQGRQQYDQQHYGHPQGQQAYDQQQYGHPQGQQQYDQQHYVGHAQPQQYQQGGWDGQGTPMPASYGTGQGDPYGGATNGYGAEQPDLYQTPEAYPPPEPPQRRRTEPEPAPRTDWDPDPEEGEEEHAFFKDGGDDDEDDEYDDPKARRDRGDKGGKAAGGKGKKKRRNGCACLVVVLVFGGGLGGVGYVGWKYYQNRYGAAPDYAGGGISQTVSVEIPKGAGGYDIGRRLKDAGVVKSVDAFVAAQQENPDGKKIQAGAYVLKKQMSAASAVEMMLDPKSQANVIVTPGERNAAVYAALDKRLDLSAGSTKKIAKKEYKSLGLPSWANADKDIKDPLEGFLYPGTYPAAKNQKPAEILKQMVGRAKAAYDKNDLTAKAKTLGLDTPLQLLTVASLVQAEGKTHDDFRKMAEVVYNRLKPTNHETNQLLQFDSTFNYLKGQSSINISESEINSNKDPYNTYTQKGLPPGPIGNPGEEAMAAALNPTHDGWIYFVATDGQNKTEFAKTYADFQKLKEKFNDSSGN